MWNSRESGSNVLNSIDDVDKIPLNIQLFAKNSDEVLDGVSDVDEMITMLKNGNRSGNVITYDLDDGSRVIFRADYGNNAHTMPGRGYSSPIDHFNIEVHKPNGNGGYSKIKNSNMHIVPLDNGGFDIWFK